LFRIFRAAFVLLASMLLCIGLMAARPLPPAAPIAAPSIQQPLAAMLEPVAAGPAPEAGATSPALPARPVSRAGGEIEAEIRVARLERPRRAPAPALRSDTLPAPARIAGDGPRMAGTLVVQTNRLDLYVGKNTFSADQVAELAPLLEWLLRKDEARLGTTLKRRVSIAFYRAALAPAPGVRGMAYTDSGRVEIYYRPYEDPQRAATIAAHELGHHLEVERYGEEAQRRADTILHEGLATWIAGHSWLEMCDAPTWRERARSLRDAGVPLRLLTAERSGADNAFELWASFVLFLPLLFGWETFDTLYMSGRGRAPGSSSYRKVLGKSLDELADEWRAWVER
jgi:hypothetical protein